MTQCQPYRVLRFDTWVDPVFERILSSRPGLVHEKVGYAEPRERILEALARAQVLHISAARDEVPPEWIVTDELLGHCPRLLCVSSSGAGYDTIDVDACTRAGVIAVNQAGGNAASVAEHTMALLLAVTHRIAQSDRWLRAAARGFSREELMGREIGGLTIGLVGIGHIGRRVAALARAFGMQVIASDPYLAPDEIERRGAEPVSLDTLLSRADVVSLHCPRNAETLRMFGAPQYARMKPGAIFISTARGGIHDEAALANALAAGQLSGAGLDVWDVEPPAPDSPLLGFETVVGTYHTAGVTHEGRRNVARIAAEQILAVLDGQQPSRLLNPPAWDACRERLERQKSADAG